MVFIYQVGIYGKSILYIFFFITVPLLITPSKSKKPVYVISSPKTKLNHISPSKSDLKNKIKKLDRENRTLKQKLRRQKNTICSIKDLLKELKDKKLIETDSEMLLLNKFDGLPQEIVSNMLKNKNKNATNRRYSQIIKEFALTLYFYSPKAYEYARYESALTLH